MRDPKKSSIRFVIPLAFAFATSAACSDESEPPESGGGRPALHDRPTVPDDWNVGVGGSQGTAGGEEPGVTGGRVEPSAGAPSGGVPTTGTGGGESVGGEADGGAPVLPPGPCIRLESGEPLPARSAVMTDQPPESDRTILTSEVFQSFKTSCGSCHAGGVQLGGFDGISVTPDNFSTLVGQSAVDRIRENSDLTKVMPQGSDLKLWGERKPGDPVVQLANLLELWIAAGRPRNYFTVRAQNDPGTAYLFSRELGESLTNIGNCLPDPKSFGIEHAEMDALDETFAKAKDLPSRLEQTDLISFDSEMLARRGLAAYAPAYPLFTDNAGKLRYVRVPRGQSIRFNESAQDFEIPANTRFYKTFLMPVTDSSGEHRYRKIETRLLVSRPDDCSSGTCKVTALMGTYLWNPEETAATLVTQPQNDGKPFGDLRFTYPFDEVKEQQAREEGGDLGAARRHYATPGRQRCVDCHMGSSSKSFIVGFSPLQVVRWPYVDESDMHAQAAKLKGFGILIESAPKGDELTQLERLVDYGVISGLSSADAVKSLKDSQPKPPRNGFELTAQSYMLGNCAHCHNPRGLPSVLNPILTDMLNFQPLTQGGIFQFPLDRNSPRTFRGESGQYSIPYITPSVYDVECTNGVTNFCDSVTDGWQVYRAKRVTDSTSGKEHYIKAPWRSLIWRNVDTPFTYTDFFTLYPHMPMHSPGFDCRAPRIMGDWMVSIPAFPKAPLDARTFQENPSDEIAQPYVEIGPDAPRHAGAVSLARARIKEYHFSERYGYCPDTSDIVDPDVERGAAVTPRDREYFVKNLPWQDNVPDRAHWVNTDATEPLGEWLPRRNLEWKGVLVDGKAPEADANRAEQQRLVDMMRSADLRMTDAFRTWATTERPFTHWKDPDACATAFQAKPQPTIATLPEPKPRWTGTSPAKDQPTAPVYSVSPGAAIFFNVCINCHGPTGDGQSNLATSIFTLTGGSTRVANLTGGILGPATAPGGNRARVFGSTATQLGLGVDDLAARYVVWMALGGTQKQLPASALLSVANTEIAGVRRRGDPTVGSANMLETGHQLCQVALPSKLDRAQGGEAPAEFNPGVGGGRDYSQLPLISRNGDAELWETLCAFGQKTPVRMIVTVGGHARIGVGAESVGRMQGLIDSTSWDLYDPDAYGNNPVMTPRGVVNGVGNEPYTWCAASAAQFKKPAADYPLPEGVPICPDPVAPKTWTDVLWNQQRARDWALRGAMNGGLAVFAYLDAIAKGKVKPSLQYNECAALAR